MTRESSHSDILEEGDDENAWVVISIETIDFFSNKKVV